MPTVRTCHACKKEVSVGRSVGRKEACPSCGADLRCCLNCSLFDRAASKQCREPLAELVKEKSRSNFCEFFAFVDSQPGGRDDSPAIDQARKTLDELFKK
jgi:hypothetical protein